MMNTKQVKQTLEHIKMWFEEEYGLAVNDDGGDNIHRTNSKGVCVCCLLATTLKTVKK